MSRPVEMVTYPHTKRTDVATRWARETRGSLDRRQMVVYAARVAARMTGTVPDSGQTVCLHCGVTIPVRGQRSHVDRTIGEWAGGIYTPGLVVLVCAECDSERGLMQRIGQGESTAYVADIKRASHLVKVPTVTQANALFLGWNDDGAYRVRRNSHLPNIRKSRYFDEMKGNAR